MLESKVAYLPTKSSASTAPLAKQYLIVLFGRVPLAQRLLRNRGLIQSHILIRLDSMHKCKIQSFANHQNKKRTLSDSLFVLVGGRRLELLHIAAPDPKSGASTNFATRPLVIFNCQIFVLRCGSLVDIVYQPLTKQYLIVLLGRVPTCQSIDVIINLP